MTNKKEELKKITAKEFLQGKTLTGLEVVNDILLSFICDQVLYGVITDTSNIVFGTPVEVITDFTLAGDILEFKTISLDLNNVYLYR
jgi:hypothetical protein